MLLFRSWWLSRIQSELNRISEQLRILTESSSSYETVRRTLETTIKDLTIRLEEAEMSSNGKKPLAKLQSRVSKTSLIVDWLIDLFVSSNIEINCCYIKSNILYKKINSQKKKTNIRIAVTRKLTYTGSEEDT